MDKYFNAAQCILKLGLALILSIMAGYWIAADRPSWQGIFIYPLAVSGCYWTFSVFGLMMRTTYSLIMSVILTALSLALPVGLVWVCDLLIFPFNRILQVIGLVILSLLFPVNDIIKAIRYKHGTL